MRARDYQLTKGIHAGKTIDQIASTDRGLLYLDRLLGGTSPTTDLFAILTEYLTDPVIAREIDSLLGDD